MALDQFRSTLIRLDKANQYAIENQFVKQGDANGRSLLVQVTNAGLVEEQNNIALNLKWRNLSTGSTGYDNFVVEDASQGLFKFIYPTEMTSSSGYVVCDIEIIENETIVNTRSFRVQVESAAVDGELISSSNEFSALQTALVRVTNLEENYAPELQGLTEQLAEKAGKTEVESLETRMADVIQSADLDPNKDQELVEARNGATTLHSRLSKIDLRKTSSKNLFNPNDVLAGQAFLSSGALSYNGNYKRTPKYPVSAGTTVSISGIGEIGRGAYSSLSLVHLWSGVSGETFVSAINLPIFETTDYLTFTLPTGTTHISMNIMDYVGIPPRIQIEKAAFPTEYEPYNLIDVGVAREEFDSLLYDRSTKNIYDGKVSKKLRAINITLQDTSSENDTVSSFIPVEFGKYYTISGLFPLTQNKNILGYSSNKLKGSTNFVKMIAAYSGSSVTIYIDDPNIKFIIFTMTSNGINTYKEALNNLVQVEEGQSASIYEPYQYLPSVKKMLEAERAKTDANIKHSQVEVISQYVEIDRVRLSQSEVGSIERDISPLGVSYAVQGTGVKDSLSNNLFAQFKATKKETREIFANLTNYVNGSVSVGKLKPTLFTVPSGQFDNPGTLPNWDTQFNKDDYCHPDIAYDATGVGGYKYWMISSILPALNMGDVVWEDEDLFVSNDGKNWLRVKSLYEDAKTYTTASLSLPPQNLAKANARKHAFLPCPANGDTIEISVPADNGMPALDNVTITLTELPWKHDPAILIDGGYVYTYHSFHLPYADRNGGKNRFIVCVRTNNGIDWEVVRTDGSTMLLTEETSRQIFTKDAQGRYNYMYYAYNRPYSNPTVLKYGTSDYELVYGGNYSFRVKGIAPYSFDFATQFPFQDKGSGNHPGLMLDGTNLYLLNNTAMFVSTNRGETFTQYSKYPAWIGGIAGMAYKKTLCKGAGGKVFLVEAQRQKASAPTRPNVNGFSATSDVHQLYIYEYASVADMVTKAQTGLVDGYIDVQIAKVNLNGVKRSNRFYPYISNLNSTTIVNRPLQRVKIADIALEEGDTLFIYVTLNSRNGAKIIFGGIDLV